HKSMIQCSRIAFGFVGIFDQDEAERIIEGQATHVVEPSVIPPEQVDDRTRGLVYKLIERAEASNAWNSALEYANEHFQGVELTFAKQEIFNAQQQAAKALTQPLAS
ncbi:phage recombination protein Bet, partial [Escherichia coli]|nr:phage recombination protein Bet [Escherichia coli]